MTQETKMVLRKERSSLEELYSKHFPKKWHEEKCEVVQSHNNDSFYVQDYNLKAHISQFWESLSHSCEGNRTKRAHIQKCEDQKMSNQDLINKVMQNRRKN